MRAEGKLAEDYKQWAKEKEQTIPQFIKRRLK